MGKDWARVAAVADHARLDLAEAGPGSRSRSGRWIGAWIGCSRLVLAFLGQGRLVTGSFVVAWRSRDPAAKARDSRRRACWQAERTRARAWEWEWASGLRRGTCWRVLLGALGGCYWRMEVVGVPVLMLVVTEERALRA